jgi:hypothetical protein
MAAILLMAVILVITAILILTIVFIALFTSLLLEALQQKQVRGGE